MLAIIMMLIAFRNMQSDMEETQSEADNSDTLPSNFLQVRSSFINPRRRIDSDVKQIKTTLSKQKGELQNEVKRWSISNASSDFNRVGLMNSQHGGKPDKFEFSEEHFQKKYNDLLKKGMDKYSIE